MNRACCPSVGVGTSSGASSSAPARTRTGTARPRPVTGWPPSRTVTPRPGPHPAEPADGRGRDRPGERHAEGDRGRATERGEVDQRGVGLAERQSRPGEPTERGAAPQCLLGDPEQGDDERTDPGCPGQRRRALQQGGGPADQRDVEGLQHRQGQPRRLAHVDPGPREHRHEAGQAGDEAEQQTPPGRDVAGSRGRAGRRRRGRAATGCGRGTRATAPGRRRARGSGGSAPAQVMSPRRRGRARVPLVPTLRRPDADPGLLSTEHASPSVGRPHPCGQVTGKVVPRIWKHTAAARASHPGTPD